MALLWTNHNVTGPLYTITENKDIVGLIVRNGDIFRSYQDTV